MIASRSLGLSARLTQSVCSNLRAFSAVVDSVDYVVAGGGSAGCVLVNRLSEDVSSTVMLLEAGKSDRGKWDSWKIQMPSALTYNLHDDKYNWNFWTVPQVELKSRTVHQPRGKALGGSSSLNAMAYVRGHALDYERWATTDGATDWSYGACLPYFKKAQTHMYGRNEYRGGEGPLYVSREWHSNPLNDAFVQAGVQAGYPHAADMNGYQQEGFGNMDMTVGRNGERANTSNAYLRPAMSRGNVTVQTESVVTRILWSGGSDGSKRAVGLEYRQGGETKQILANKEVILSLGAVGSPHVLMLSGVGDKQHLADHGIECQIDLPEVGQNLQDHLETYVQYSCTKPVSLLKYASWQQPWHKIMAGVQWFLQGTGVCASNHFEVGGFIRSRAGVRHPDLQYHFIPLCVHGQCDILPEHGYQFHCGTMRPASRGEVKLASSNPFDAPLIDPKYLTEEEDLTDLRNALRLTVEIASQSAFDEFRGRRIAPTDDVDMDDDAQVDNFIRESLQSAYHPSCTCAIGRVVDQQGRVFGASGLRVVDASIMPSITSGNLNAPTIMLAEKCADAIRNRDPLPADPQPYYIPKNWETSQR